MARSSERRPAAALLVAVCLLGIVSTSCVRRLSVSRAPSPAATVLDGVPLYDFGDDDCGPGSLATVLTFHGLPVTPEAVGQDMPRTPRGDVLSIDLMLAARGYGLEARWVRGDLAELGRVPASGKPGIVTLRVLNAPGKRRDLYHYAVIDGHDPAGELFRVLLGDGKARWVPASRIERTWRGAGHALMVPEPLDPTALPPDVVFRRAVALERSGEPDRAAALHDEAEQAYRLALERAPDSVEAMNNLAWSLHHRGTRLEEAERLARRAASVADAGAPVVDTLARVLVARGKCGEAVSVLEQALATIGGTAGQRAMLDHALEVASRCAAAVSSAR